MNNGLQEQQETGAGTFDIRSYFFQCLSKWYLFVLAAAGAWVYAWYEVRYTVPTYSVTATILVKDEYSSWGREYFLSGLELVSARNRLVNEIGIMKSFPTVRKALDQLDFEVSYFDVGRIKTTELYKSTPYYVVPDSVTKVALAGRRFDVRIVSDKMYDLGYGAKGPDDPKTYRFGEKISAGGGRFTIHLRTGRYTKELSEKQYFFVVNDLDRIAKSYQGRVNIRPLEKESSIIELSLAGQQIDKEIDFLNALLDVYIQGGLEHNNRIAVNTMFFIEEQLSIITDSLRKAEMEMMQFTTMNRDLGFGEAPLVSYNDLVELEKSRGMAELEQRYFEYLRDYLDKKDEGEGLIVPSAMGINDNVLNALVTRLLNLYTEREAILFSTKNAPDNPMLGQIDRQIETTKAFLLESLNNVMNKATLENGKLERDISTAEQKVNKLPAAQREQVNIERRYKLNNNLYTYLLQKKAEASLARAANLPNASILDKAGMLNVSFVGPVSSKTYTTSFLTGMSIPFVLVFFITYFNDRVREKKDIERATDMPVVGMVHHSNKGTNLVVVKDLKSSIAEAFRSIRNNVAYMTEGAEKVTVLITSSVSGEGKTFCAINLASVYAAAGKKTLLMGADLRKPKIYQDFGLDNSAGVSNYLIGRAEMEQIVRPTGMDNIDLVSAGPVPPNPAELLESGRMGILLGVLKERYDTIIIDTPPMGLVTDAFLLMKFSDVNLHLIRHNYTRKTQLGQIGEHYRIGKIRSIGIVVNDIRTAGYGYYGYGYAYGYGNGYGYGYYSDGNRLKYSGIQERVKRIFVRKD